MSFRPTAIQKDNVEIRPGSPIVSAAEEVLCAQWDGNLRLPDSANPDLVARAALMILDCASGEANNNNRMPFIVPEECWNIGGIILELVRVGNKVKALIRESGKDFNPEEDTGIVLNLLERHGYSINQPDPEEGEND